MAEVEPQIGGAASDLDRPWDAVGQGEDDVATVRAKEMERREARALVDFEPAVFVVEADRRRVFPAGIIHVHLVEPIAEAGGIDIDRGGAVIHVERRSRQTTRLR